MKSRLSMFRCRETAAFYKFILLVAGVAVFIAAIPHAGLAQEGGQTGPTAITTPAAKQSAVRLRKPTLQELYGMFLKYAAHVDARSDADERAGKDRSFYRRHMQVGSGLTPDEYLQVLDTARKFVAADADIEHQIEEWNKTVLGDQGNPPSPSLLALPVYHSELKRLWTLRQSALESDIENLKEVLGSDRSKVLEVYLKGSFSSPVIGARSTQGASGTVEQPTAPPANSGATRQMNKQASSVSQPQLTASPEDVTIGNGPNCNDFTSYPGEVSSICQAASLSYLGSGNGNIEVWGVFSYSNVYGFDYESDSWLMEENGAEIPYSLFSNCYNPANYTLPCDINLNYNVPVTYVLTAAALVYYWYDCNGPCAAAASATVSVSIVSPSITSISQTQFQAGQSGTLTITGSNFTSPFMNPPFIGDLWGCFSTLSVTQFAYPSPITASFSVPSTLPDPDPWDCEPGSGEYLYESNGFADAIEPISITATPPSINGPDGNPVNSSQSSPIQVIAGAPVSLSVVAPSGMTITSQSWSFGNSGDAVANFIATAGSGGPVAVTDTTSSNLNFFFIVPGATETVTANVRYSDGETASETEWYSVGGPTGNILPNVFVQQNNTATVITDSNANPLNPIPTANPAYLVMGNAPGQPSKGISFNDLATLPQGQFIWVQILNSVTYSALFQANQNYAPPTNLGLGLDGNYPYPSGGPNSPSISTSDAPAWPDLWSYLGEAGESFDATMYVLWDPAIPPAGQQSCTPAWIDTSTSPYISNPSTCASIPVPLASVNWTWKPCVINALASAGNGFTPSWFTQCGPGNYSPAVAGGYPEWGSCDKSKNGSCQ